MTSLEPGPLGNGVASRRFRRELSAEDHHDLAMRRGTLDKSKRMERCLTREAGSARRGTLSTLENNFPTALPMLLAMVEGPDRLPAVEGKQEVLKGKLRVLEADSAEVIALFTEMSAQIISINSEENIIFVTFKTFEEIWKFTTYFTMGFLGQCMENLLLDQEFWLCSLDHEDLGIEISIQEETLNLMYIGLLMQEGSFFASCSSHQMFDSSTSGGDLYLEQGDIALFEPPFLGSGWTVLSLGDGARGTKARPALQPVVPFYQWFLKSCPENILVGSGRPVCDFPLQFARGTCVAAAAYDAEGPDELSLAHGDRIIIVGLLVSCFDWFAGKQENTGEVGLVRTCMVKPDQSTCEAPDIFLSREEREFLSLREECLVPHTIALLKKTSHNIMSSIYKLDLLDEDEPPTQPVQNGRMDADERSELKRKVERILSAAKKAKVPPSIVTSNGTHGSESPEVLEPGAPLFSVDPVDEAAGSSQSILFLLDFLDGSVHKPEFGTLYSLSPELLAAAFEGQSDDDELVAYLGVARETARKKRLYWSQSRLCFFLGKLCVGRLKFSQARVYLEEALSVPRDSFTDMLLLASIYASLASIYLMQKNTEKYFALSERIAALLMGYPDCISSLEKDPEVHRFVLKKAVLAHNKMAEARACFLLAKLHRRRGEGASAAPFVERLLVLQVEPPGTPSVKPSQGYLSLGRIYSDLSLPHLSVSAAWRACMQSSTRLADCLSGVGLVLENSSRLFGIHKQEMTVPAQVAPYLVRALAISEDKGGGEGGGGGMDQALIQALTLCLSQLFQMHGMLGKAVRSMHTLIDRTSSSRSTVGSTELNGALIWLAWLHINHGEAGAASDILESVLASLPELCTSPQEGLVLNMLGVARRRSGDLRGAAESYRAAAAVCEEFEDAANWAVALANLGLLCLRAGARGLAQRRLEEAVQRFSGLEVNDGHEGNFVPVLLELGGIYVEEGLEERGKIYYEWALLVAMMSNHTEGQLRATRRLCHLYGSVCPDEAQCIIYNEHQLGLLRGRGERGREGDILEAISRLYLSLGTERAYRSALEYTKRSLGICIDLGLREKEAYAWLQAGRIYLLLGQEELVDLYVQVAQDVGLGTGNTVFILGLLEAAGDVFFNGGKDLDRAVSFYRDRALPIAVKTGSVAARLRLCNKLVELLLRLQQCGEAVEFAQTALQLSVSLGDHLNERVAYHRLAAVYHSLSQFELTEHYYLKTLSLCPAPLQFDEETLYYVRVYQTLGDITFYDLKDPFDAAGYYHLALAAAMDLGNKKSQLQLCTRLATIYHNFLVDRELSLFFYQKARGFASDLNIRRINLAPDQQHRSVPQYKSSSR